MYFIFFMSTTVIVKIKFSKFSYLVRHALTPSEIYSPILKLLDINIIIPLIKSSF